MKFYDLEPNIKSLANKVIYPHGKIYDALYDFFVLGTTDVISLPKNIVGKCQPGISQKNFLGIDYFCAFGQMPIFSDRFVEAANKIGIEMDFYKTILIAEDVQRELNIGRILNRMHIVDYDRSGIGTGNYSIGTYYKKDIDSNFYIAREINDLCSTRFIVSERFKVWAKNNKFNIKFTEVAFA